MAALQEEGTSLWQLQQLSPSSRELPLTPREIRFSLASPQLVLSTPPCWGRSRRSIYRRRNKVRCKQGRTETTTEVETYENSSKMSDFFGFLEGGVAEGPSAVDAFGVGAFESLAGEASFESSESSTITRLLFLPSFTVASSTSVSAM